MHAREENPSQRSRRSVPVRSSCTKIPSSRGTGTVGHQPLVTIAPKEEAIKVGTTMADHESTRSFFDQDIMQMVLEDPIKGTVQSQ